jgi:hypothetical protein
VKRVLFDENMPRKLRRDIPEFAVRTVQEEGWAGLKNGELLRKAAFLAQTDSVETLVELLTGSPKNVTSSPALMFS